MKDEVMLALAKEFAKNLKTEADLNNFSKALKKLTVETALNAELTDEKHCFARVMKKTAQEQVTMHAMAIQPNAYLPMMVSLS